MVVVSLEIYQLASSRVNALRLCWNSPQLLSESRPRSWDNETQRCVQGSQREGTSLVDLEDHCARSELSPWMCWLCTLLHQHIKYRKHPLNCSAALARAVVKPICSYREARSALLQQASWLGLAWGPERALRAWESKLMELVFIGKGSFRALVLQGCHYQGP